MASLPTTSNQIYDYLRRLNYVPSTSQDLPLHPYFDQSLIGKISDRSERFDVDSLLVSFILSSLLLVLPSHVHHFVQPIGLINY